MNNMQPKSQPIPTKIDVTPRNQLEDGVVSKNFKQLLYDRLGVEELFNQMLWRASFAELIGTAVLAFMLDTIVISSSITNSNNTNLHISVFVFVIVTIMIVSIAPISGGHMNPIASFSSTLLGFISPIRAVVFILAQCIGAALAAVALKMIVSDAMQHIFSLSGCTITPAGDGGLAVGKALLLESICTFVFLFVSLSIAFDPRRAEAHGLVMVSVMVGAVMGILTFISTTVTTKAGYSGAAMNPAKCFGPAVVRGGHLWDGHWVFWVGPAISCLVFYVYVKLGPRRYVSMDEPRFDAAETVKVLFLAWLKN